MADIKNPNTPLNTIKNWFKTGLIPTQAQFWALFDSFWHKSEIIPVEKINHLQNLLDEKADAEVVSTHLSDADAHKTLFDNKVDTVAGKGLSTNDFTDELKQLLDKLGDYGKMFKIEQDGYYLPSHNRGILFVENDATLTVPNNLPIGFRCYVYVKGNYTLTNVAGVDVTIFPLETSILTEGKMQTVMRYFDTNDFAIVGDNK